MEASNVLRAVTVASQTNAALCVANVTSKMTADIVAQSRRRGTIITTTVQALCVQVFLKLFRFP